MNLLGFVFWIAVALLLTMFMWALRKRTDKTGPIGHSSTVATAGHDHATYWPQVRQALSREDLEYLGRRGSRETQQRAARERREIALVYLGRLRGDFERLLLLATAIAVLSPEVDAVHELERLRLNLEFSLRYQWIRLLLHCHAGPATQLSALSTTVTGLTVRLEAAMKELGERAALAAELASSLDRSRLNAV